MIYIIRNVNRFVIQWLDVSGLGRYLHSVISCLAHVLLILAVGLYDHILTLDEESKYIWPNPTKRASLLFFLSRYFGSLAVGPSFINVKEICKELVLPDCRGIARNLLIHTQRPGGEFTLL